MPSETRAFNSTDKLIDQSAKTTTSTTNAGDLAHVGRHRNGFHILQYNEFPRFRFPPRAGMPHPGNRSSVEFVDGWNEPGQLISLRVLLQSKDGQEYQLNPPFRENLQRALCALDKTPWQVCVRARQ